MFSGDMIAPCGLNCSLCEHALKTDNPCHGCNSTDGSKPDFCATRCKVINCELRKGLDGAYCDSCAKFPCEFVLEKENSYASAYPMQESPIGNLRCIKENGMDAFLAKERERWFCKECGEIICVHTGLCGKCGKDHSEPKP